MNAEKLYLEIINNICDGVYVIDSERRITFWNKAAENITGYKKEEIVGEYYQNNILNHIDVDGCPLYATLIDGQKRKNEVFLQHKDGHRIPVSINIFPFVDEDNTIGAIKVFKPSSPDTYENDLIEKLSDLAMNDPLTGVANRRKLENYLEYRFYEMKKFQNKFCVIFLDIDNFSTFNDTHGHELGDEVLKVISQSIKNSIRKNDLFGRWGGEEFLGIFEIAEDHEATLMAEKIRILISKSEVYHKSGTISVTASLGVTMARDNDTIDTIINRADLLMYRSKQNNKNCVTSDI